MSYTPARTAPHLLIVGEPPAELPSNAHRRLTVSLLPSDVSLLLALGHGRLSAGIASAIAHVIRLDPNLIPKMDLAAPIRSKASSPSASATTRSTRDALIYHECIARTFTRAEIAKRHGLSLIRVHQIYAKQSQTPPPFPTTFTYASPATPTDAHLIVEGVPRTAGQHAPIHDLLANWLD